MSERKSVDEIISSVTEKVSSIQTSLQDLKQTTETAGAASSDTKGTSDQKGYESVRSDVKIDEALEQATLSMTRSWNNNDKSLVEDSRDYNRTILNNGLHLQRSLDHIHLSEMSTASVARAFMNIQLAASGKEREFDEFSKSLEANSAVNKRIDAIVAVVSSLTDSVEKLMVAKK